MAGSITVAGVGTLTFDRLSGMFPPLTEVIADVSRPNIDGHAFQKWGKRAAPAQFDTSVAISNGTVSLAAIDEEFTAYQSLKNGAYLATVVLENGTTYQNVAILEVTPNPGRPWIIVPSGGTQGYTARGLADPRIIVFASWLMQRTS